MKKLPKDWDMFKSFSWEISCTQLKFFCKLDKVYLIEFYWRRIKTPWTTFISDEKYIKIEKEIYSIIENFF